MVIAASAMLKAGQNEKSIKSMTNFLKVRSIRFPSVPAKKNAVATCGNVCFGIFL